MSDTIQPTEQVPCPFCDGKKRVIYVADTTKTIGGVECAALAEHDSVCNRCLGHGTVHPLKAQVIEREMEEARQAYEASQQAHIEEES